MLRDCKYNNVISLLRAKINGTVFIFNTYKAVAFLFILQSQIRPLVFFVSAAFLFASKDQSTQPNYFLPMPN